MLNPPQDHSPKRMTPHSIISPSPTPQEVLVAGPPPARASSSLTWWAAVSFAAIVGFSRISYGLLLPSIRTDLRGTYSSYGLVSTANFVGYLLGTLMVPLVLASYRDRIKLNSGALLLMNVMMILSATSLNVFQLAIWRFLVGLFSSPALVLTLALTLERITPEERGRASGIVWMGASLGVFLSGLIAPFVISTGSMLSWRVVWIVMGTGGGITVFGLHHALYARDARLLPTGTRESYIQSTRTKHSMASLLAELLRPRGFLFATLSYVGYGFGYIIYLTFFVALVIQQGLPSLLVGLIWAAMGLMGAASGVIWGRAIDRWPTGFILAVTLVWGALGAASVLTQNSMLETVGAAVFGLSVFLGPPLIVTSLLRRVVSGERYPSSYSFLNTLFGIGQVIGPLIGGMVVDQIGLLQGTALAALVLGVAALFALGYGIAQFRGEGALTTPSEM